MSVKDSVESIYVRTPQSVVEALLNQIKELSEEVRFLTDALIGPIPSSESKLVKGYNLVGVLGEISDNCDEGIGLVIEAKENLSRIRNAIGK